MVMVRASRSSLSIILMVSEISLVIHQKQSLPFKSDGQSSGEGTGPFARALPIRGTAKVKIRCMELENVLSASHGSSSCSPGPAGQTRSEPG